jgi:glycosyltransferase involved in cell wall biosynthesis
VRILHTESSRGWGGQELRILAEARGMMARGHAVWIAAPPESRIAQAASASGLALIGADLRRVWAARDLRRLCRAIRTLGIEVVNTHSSWDSWIGGFAGRSARTGVRVVRTRHLSTTIANSWFSRVLYTRLADHVVTTGEAIREQMIQDNGFPGNRITSVVTGVDFDALQPSQGPSAVRAALGIPATVPVIGTLSTLRSWKGHLDLLEALVRLRATRDILGIFVGSGPYEEVIRARIRDLHLGTAVVMPGHREDVADLLSVMDVFAFPSTANEGVPQAVLQAMALRRPIVAAKLGGIPEIVRDGETGVLVPTRDPGALATGIAQVLDDPVGATRRAQAAVDLVRTHYTLEVMLDKMEGVYHKVCASAQDT